MTVATETRSVVSPGNGSTFTHSFTGLEVFSTAELLVLHVVEATLAVTIVAEGTGAANYAVTYNSPLVEGKSDGFLTYPADEVTPMPSTEYLMIIRDPDLLQATALKNLGVQLPKTMETVLDKMQHQIHSLQEQLDRCPKVKQGIDTSAMDLTIPDPNAGYGYKWTTGEDAFEEFLA